MLQFPCCIGFRMDIRDFFELQGAFQGDGIVYSPANEKDIPGSQVPAGKMLDLLNLS